MKKRKVLIFTGGRFEYGILRPIIREVDKSKSLELQLVVSGIHTLAKFGSTIEHIRKDGFKISAKSSNYLSENVNSKVSLEISQAIANFRKILLNLKPDLVLVNGDRPEAFAFAIASAFFPIPVAHTHGGDLTKAGFDETIRHAITKIAHIHFAATAKSRDRILRMGEDPKYVFLTGAPGLDDLISQPMIPKSEIEAYLGTKIKDRLIIVLQHPLSTSPSTSRQEITQILSALARVDGTKLLIYPNGDRGSDAIIEKINHYMDRPDFIVTKSMPRDIYTNILRFASLMVGNSSGGIIEAASFGLPVINVGLRQFGRERNSNVFDIVPSSSKIEELTNGLLRSKKKYSKKNIYGTGKSAKKIVSLLESLDLGFNLIQKHFYEKS